MLHPVLPRTYIRLLSFSSTGSPFHVRNPLFCTASVQARYIYRSIRNLVLEKTIRLEENCEFPSWVLESSTWQIIPQVKYSDRCFYIYCYNKGCLLQQGLCFIYSCCQSDQIEISTRPASCQTKSCISMIYRVILCTPLGSNPIFQISTFLVLRRQPWL